MDSPWIANVLVERKDCEVANFMVPNIEDFVLERVSPGKEHSNHLLSIRHLDKEKLSTIKTSIPNTTRIGRDKIWCQAKACSACKVMASMGALIIRSRFHSTTGIEYRVLCPNSKFANRVLDITSESGLTATMLSSNEVEYPLSMTKREIEIVLTAHEKGLFDDRRRISLRELANDLGISPPTLSNLLRRSIRKIVEMHMEEVL